MLADDETLTARLSGITSRNSKIARNMKETIGKLRRQLLHLEAQSEEKSHGAGHKRPRRSAAAQGGQPPAMYTTRKGEVYTREQLMRYLNDPTAIRNKQKRNDILFGIALMLKADRKPRGVIERRLEKWSNDHYELAPQHIRGRTAPDKRIKELKSMIRRIFEKDLQFK